MAEATQRSIVTRFVAVTVAAPAIVTAAAVALAWSWRGQLPDPIAVHWGPAGEPDGFGSLTGSLVLMAVVGFGLPAVMALTLTPYLRGGGRGATLRLLGGMGLGLSVMITVLVTWSIGMQRGVTDAAAGPAIWWALAGAFLASVVAGVAAYFAQPAQHAQQAATIVGDPIHLRDGEHVAWIRAARGARWLGTLGVVITALMAVLTAVVVVAGDAATAWITGGATVFLALVFASMTAFTVRVDDWGVRVRSRAGFPTLSVPLAQIKEASAVTVQGFAEFGGYGLRMNADATGVVLTNGEALRVERTAGRALVVTVDDAATAAALVNALVARRGAARA